MDLSNIVKAVPKVSSEEDTEDQTHEVLQVLNEATWGGDFFKLDDQVKLHFFYLRGNM